jgi:hypothetical protein
VHTVEIDATAVAATLDMSAATEQVNVPCPLCGTLVRAVSAEQSGLSAVQPCGCRI